jgi:hypothetical protein
MFTEFGADAFNVVNKSEDQNLRLIICWVVEIYENASELRKAGNSIGVYFSI